MAEKKLDTLVRNWVWIWEQCQRRGTGILSINTLRYHIPTSVTTGHEFGDRAQSALAQENSYLLKNREDAVISRAMSAHGFTSLQAFTR